jgi:hypothetical protein
MTSAVLIVGGAISTGGVGAVVHKKFGGKNNSAAQPDSSPSKEERHG